MSDTKVKEGSIINNWASQLSAGETLWLDDFYKENRSAFLQWGEKKFSLEKDELLDIYQNAMIVLYENIKHNRIDELQSSVATYLYGIAKNLVYKYYRKNELINRHEVRLSEHYQFLLSGNDEMESKYEKIYSALEAMKEPCKTILSLFYISGLKLSLVASKLDYSSTDVLKTQKSRCLKRLKELVR
jgi:RNA polymerase sigma factor (sigma-70 family)